MFASATGIVCERSGQWAAAWRLALRREPQFPATAPSYSVRLFETRTAEDCLASLAEHPRSLVAVELTRDGCDAALALVSAVARHKGDAPVVVLAAREMAPYEWLARELGAVHFVSGPCRLDEIVDVARQFWDRLPQPDLGSADAVWNALPWQ